MWTQPHLDLHPSIYESLVVEKIYYQDKAPEKHGDKLLTQTCLFFLDFLVDIQKQK